MDVKRITIFLIYMFSIEFLNSCQKKEEKPVVIVDNSNSEFAGKACYGKALKNQYIVLKENGFSSIFYGTKEQLQEKLIENLKEPNKIIFAEQDRELDLKFLSNNQEFKPFSYFKNKNIYWQVWGQEDTQVNSLWDKKIKGEGIIVAVVDAGVDINHPALINRILINTNEIPNNGIDDDNNGLVDDVAGYDFANQTPYSEAAIHGSHVAGIIAAEPKDSPMLGIAPEAKLLPLNIMGEKGGGTLTSAILAIKYAQSRGAKIINASWGGSVCAESLKQIIISVADQGVLFISAAGNDGVDIQQSPEFPAAFGLPNQITVGATVPSGLMASFSNYSRNLVSILAPGHQILSTVPGGWQIASGTSMAAPFVSGIAALIWSAHPEAKMDQIKTAILGSVKNPQNYNPVQTQGRINAPLALERLELLLEQEKTKIVPN